MKRVLLTGATGFIGRQTIDPLLERGYEVHALTSHPGRRGRDDVTWHCLDLLDARDLGERLTEIQPSHLLHLAWYVEHGRFWTAPENLHWVAASLKLTLAFAAAAGRRIVAAGTCAEYDWSCSPLSEASSPLRPTTVYGAAKHALHGALEAFCRQQGLSLAWGRMFFLYGPGEPPNRLVPAVIRALLAGEPALVGSGQQVRDLLHVEDAANAFVALLDSSVEGAVNIASGAAVPLEQIVHSLGEILEHPELIRLGALPTPVGDPAELTADTSRLNNEVGWRPQRSLDEGLAATVRWWRQRNS